jgi:hypothetical protein
MTFLDMKHACPAERMMIPKDDGNEDGQLRKGRVVEKDETMKVHEQRTN